MKKFMCENFLLGSATAEKLFYDYSEKLPIIDYHCHINPKEIAQDKRFKNITQIWLGADHYKWRLMRAGGIDEHFITGDASDKDKFIKWAEILGKAIGNPLYHWSHLELQRFFGYKGILNKSTAEYVWSLCNEKLTDSSMSARNLIKKSNVETICTTDEPTDSLEWHKALANSKSFATNVFPTWRPDRALNIENDGFIEYMKELSSVSGIKINSFNDLMNALSKRMKYFDETGCRISDHAFEKIIYTPSSDEETEAIFAKRMNCNLLSHDEEMKYKTAFIRFSAREYKRLGWAMQLHYGCKRDNNTIMLERTGVDSGFDCISACPASAKLADLLNALCLTDSLPKTIIYSLNPNDNTIIDTVAGCFQNCEAIGKIQHGSAWWFNDNLEGMRAQITSLAAQGYLAGFIGMLTDSRSFLSYPRHEYFRRILCDIIGKWVENGEYPDDMNIIGEIVSDISYYNAKRYFGFKSKAALI